MRARTVIGLAIAAMALSRRRDIPWGTGWFWPVPPVRLPDGRTFAPVVSHEFEQGHFGVDILFRDAGKFFAPVGTPITAARAGRVWSVRKTERGWGVVIDHGKPFATFYQHLSSVEALAVGAPVGAGQRLGVMGIDPTDPERVRHLHFAVWFEGQGDAASVDLLPVIGRWQHAATWSVP